MRTGIYVYCFCEGIIEEQVEISGMEKDNPVYFINHNQISAVVSDVPQKVYEPSKINILAHESVIQSSMRKYNLVPCSFCSIFKCKSDLLLFMDKAYVSIVNNLDRVRGKEESGLRVFWKKSTFLEEIQTNELVTIKDGILKTAEAKNPLSIMEFGKLVEERVNERRAYYKKAIYEPIASYADDARLNEVTTPRMILNAAFLVKKEQGHDFDTLVENILSEYQLSLEVSYTGPWPPYNFINLNMPE